MESENKIINKDGRLRITLDVYVFAKDNVFIAYSPALDLSGYGNSEKEARRLYA